jgi:hypothetical protein
LVSNGEGYFFASKNSQTKHCLWFPICFVNQLTVGELKKLDFTIKLLPGVYELDDVEVSNIKPNPYRLWQM